MDEQAGRTWPSDSGDNVPGRDINEDIVDLITTAQPFPCNGGNSCLSGISHCLLGVECVCMSPYVYGSPNFACLREDELGAEVKNDPLLVTFGQQSIRFPYPCRYMITHVKQKLIAAAKQIGTCEFEVYGFNARETGKFFVLGFDIAAKLVFDNGEVKELSSRNYGLADNTKLTIFNSGTDDAYCPDGPWKRDKIRYETRYIDRYHSGKYIEMSARPDLKQMQYWAAKCGLKITFVPHDIHKKRRQVAVPGVAVIIKKDYHIEFLGEDKAMNLAPSWGDNGYLEGQRLHGLDEEKSMLVRAFTSNVVQNHPAGSEQCAAVGPAIGKCTEVERAAAINNCFWILDEPRFLRCFDPSHNSEKLLKLFRKCIDIFCSNGKCQDVQEEIIKTECHEVPDVDPLQSFMRGDMCPE